MENAVLVVWWVGLLVALLLTLVILKEAALLIGTVRDIATLAELTRDAARGMQRHLSSTSRLRLASAPAFALRDAAHRLARAAGSMENRLGALAAPPPPEG